MSKRQPPAQAADVDLSPYLSLRQAIRPAIFAHSILLREKDRAVALVDEANRILVATRELLSKAGLGYITVAEPGAPTGATSGLGTQASLLDAFTDAAMLWAKVVASCLALADHFLEQGQWGQVRTLAAVLDDAGEKGTAKDLRDRLLSAPLARCKKRSRALNVRMSHQELSNVIDEFTDALSEMPPSIARNSWLQGIMPSLAQAVLTHVPDAQGHVSYVAGAHYVSPSDVEPYFYEIVAAFRNAQT
jgi:hypothetical protein